MGKYKYLWLVAERRKPPRVDGYFFESRDIGIADYDLIEGWAWLISEYDPETHMAVYDLVMVKPLARYIVLPLDGNYDSVKDSLINIVKKISKKYGYVNRDAVAHEYIHAFLKNTNIYKKLFGGDKR